MWRIVKRMANCKQFLFLALLAMLIMAAILAFLPIQIQHILQATYIEQNESLTHKAILVVAMLIIIYIFSSFAGQYWIRKAEYQLTLQVYNDLFEKLLHLPACQHASLDKHRTSENTLSDILFISGKITYVVTLLIRDTLTLLGLTACLIYLNNEFALLVCILIPFILLISQIITEQQDRVFAVDKQSTGHQHTKLANRLHYILENYREIRLFGGQQQEHQQLNKTAQSLLEDDNQQDNYKTFIATLCQLLLFLIVMAITYLVIQQANENKLTLDQTGAFITAILLLINPVKRLASISRMANQMKKPLERLFTVLDQPAVSTPGTGDLTDISGKLTLENVHIVVKQKTGQASYSFDFTINAGETIALIAENKATRLLLLDLLLGFHLPTTGQLKLDDQSYIEIEPGNLFAQFAIISKTPVILNDYVAGNIAYGSTECAHEAHITKVTQQTSVSKFVREMPEGLQTRVDLSGASLTTKQWQLIAIARALLKNTPVLIIDDLWIQRKSDLSDEVFIALKQIMKNRTNILLLQAMPDLRDGIDRLFLVENDSVIEVDED